MDSYFSEGFEQTPDEIRIDLSPPSKVTGCFLTLFCLFWATICTTGSVAAISDTEPPILVRLFLVLFLIPFWGMGIFLGHEAYKVWFRRDQLRLTEEGVTYTERSRRTQRERRIPLAEVIGFRSEDSAADAEGGVSGIDVVSTGNSLDFRSHVLAFNDQQLVLRLNRRLVELRERLGVPAPPEENLADCRSCPLPSGATWRERADPDGVVLERRQEWDRFARSAVVWLAMYWVVHVGPIVAQTAQKIAQGTFREEPSRIWIAAAFVVVGSGMAALFGVQLRSPFRVSRWRVTETGTERRVRCLGVTTARRFEQDSLRQIMIVETSPTRWSLGRSVSERADSRVSGRDRAGRESWRIGGVTLGEALWIKGRIQAHIRSVTTSAPDGLDDEPSR